MKEHNNLISDERENDKFFFFFFSGLNFFSLFLVVGNERKPEWKGETPFFFNFFFPPPSHKIYK